MKALSNIFARHKRPSAADIKAFVFAADGGDTGHLRQAFSVFGKNIIDASCTMPFTGSPANALHCAAMHGHTEALMFLIESGANLEVKSDGLTPLFVAVTRAHTVCQHLLIKAGANLDATDNSGGTALMFAAQTQDVHALERLLTAKAKVNAVDHNGDTALTHAAKNRSHRCITRLLRAHANINHQNNQRDTALTLAVKRKYFLVAGQLLLNNADPNIKNAEGLTALMSAVENSDLRCFRFLVGASAEINKLNDAHFTALHMAVIANNAEFVSALTKAGADTEMPSGFFGSTALILASFTLDSQCIKPLLEAGANKDAQNELGNTALICMISSDKSDTERMKMLLDAGANIFLRNKADVNAREIALHLGKTDYIALLEQAEDAQRNAEIAVFHNGTTQSLAVNNAKLKLQPPVRQSR